MLRAIFVAGAAALGISAIYPQADRADEPIIQVDVDPLFQNGISDKLDHSTSSIDEWGCTLVTWTMFINSQCKKYDIKLTNGDPLRYTPQSMNKLLNDFRLVRGADTYNGWSQKLKPDGSLIGDPQNPPALPVGALIKAVTADTTARGNKPLVLTGSSGKRFPAGTSLIGDPDTADKIRNKLMEGIPVPVRVRDDSGNEGHSLLITSYHYATTRWDIRDSSKNADGSICSFLDNSDEKQGFDFKDTIFEMMLMNFSDSGATPPFVLPAPVFIPPEQLGDPAQNPEQWAAYVEIESSYNFRLVPEPSMATLGMGVILLKRRKSASRGVSQVVR